MNDAKHLWKLAAEITAIIERWLREHEGKTFYVRFKKIDLLRLTRLQVWSWRHKVSIEEILTLTLPYLRKSLTTKQKTRYGLGCSISALTGIGNEKILIEAIKQKYRSAEHLNVWRWEERQRQLDAEEAEEMEGLQVRERSRSGILGSDSVDGFLKSYKAQVLKSRRKMKTEITRARRKRKCYRNNPWL